MQACRCLQQQQQQRFTHPAAAQQPRLPRLDLQPPLGQARLHLGECCGNGGTTPALLRLLPLALCCLERQHQRESRLPWKGLVLGLLQRRPLLCLQQRLARTSGACRWMPCAA